MTQWQPGMIITAARLIDGPPTITTTSGLTAASGFTLNDWRGSKCGRAVELNMNLLRSGTTLALDGSGNLADTLACTAPAGWRPTGGTINGNWDDGFASGSFVIGTDGLCTLRTSSGSITGEASSAGNGRNLRLHVTFIQDN